MRKFLTISFLLIGFFIWALTTFSQPQQVPGLQTITSLLTSNAIVQALGYVPGTNSTGGGGSGDTTNIVLGTLSAAQGTNYWIDFSVPSTTLISTGDIAFRFSTNWASTVNTSRVANLFVPATNYQRMLYLFNAATNWNVRDYYLSLTVTSGYALHLQAQIFGLGETNVIVKAASLTTPIIRFDPTSVPGLVGWYNADRSAYTDTTFISPATTTGNVIKGIKDLSGTGNNLTNSGTPTVTFSTIAGPNGGPSIVFPGSDSDVFNTAALSYTQPNTVFIVFRSLNPSHNAYIMTGGSTRVEIAQLTSAGAGPNTRQGRLYAGGSPIDSDWRDYLKYQMVSLSINGASGFVNTNGIQSGTGNVGANAFNLFHIGNDINNAVGTFWKGNLQEILIYNANVSAVNRGLIEQYLMAKYSLSIQ